MSGLPIFGISRLRHSHCHVSFTCPDLRLSVRPVMAVCVCVLACVCETERTTHHRHVSIFMCFESLTVAIDNIHFLTLVEL